MEISQASISGMNNDDPPALTLRRTANGSYVAEVTETSSDAAASSLAQGQPTDAEPVEGIEDDEDDEEQELEDDRERITNMLSGLDDFPVVRAALVSGLNSTPAAGAQSSDEPSGSSSSVAWPSQTVLLNADGEPIVAPRADLTIPSAVSSRLFPSPGCSRHPDNVSNTTTPRLTNGQPSTSSHSTSTSVPAGLSLKSCDRRTGRGHRLSSSSDSGSSDYSYKRRRAEQTGVDDHRAPAGLNGEQGISSLSVHKQ